MASTNFGQRIVKVEGNYKLGVDYLLDLSACPWSIFYLLLNHSKLYFLGWRMGNCCGILAIVIRGVKRADRIRPDRNPRGPVLNGFGPFRPVFKRAKELLVQSGPSLDRSAFFIFIFYCCN